MFVCLQPDFSPLVGKRVKLEKVAGSFISWLNPVIGFGDIIPKNMICVWRTMEWGRWCCCACWIENEMKFYGSSPIVWDEGYWCRKIYTSALYPHWSTGVLRGYFKRDFILIAWDGNQWSHQSAINFCQIRRGHELWDPSCSRMIGGSTGLL